MYPNTRDITLTRLSLYPNVTDRSKKKKVFVPINKTQLYASEYGIYLPLSKYAHLQLQSGEKLFMRVYATSFRNPSSLPAVGSPVSAGVLCKGNLVAECLSFFSYAYV